MQDNLLPTFPLNHTQPDTRTLILDCAERLFSKHGINGTSVRDIIAAAGANLGAINYHFGNKDRLVLEVFARRLEPVNRARLVRLDALEKAAGKRPVELASIVEALVRPALESEVAGVAREESFVRLLGRSLVEPHPELKKWVEEQFKEVARRFDAAILRAVPGLGRQELSWRMMFFIGALHHSQWAWLSFGTSPMPSDMPPRPDLEDFIGAITAFVTAGLSAPVSRKSRSAAPKRGKPSRATNRTKRSHVKSHR